MSLLNDLHPKSNLPAITTMSHSALSIPIALDIGGTWIKCARTSADGNFEPLERFANPCREPGLDGFGFAGKIAETVLHRNGGFAPGALVMATAGEPDAAGRAYRYLAAHLGAMADPAWVPQLEQQLGCPVHLINDAEALAIGVTEAGLIPLDGSIGLLAIGTGLGFVVVRDGRWWKPARSLNLLGACSIPGGNYDMWASASRRAEAAGGDLTEWLQAPGHAADRESYLDGLAGIVATAAILHHLDEVLIGGGMADACAAAGVDISGEISRRIAPHFPTGFAAPKVSIIPAANEQVLRGALAIAAGNQTAESARFRASFDSLKTEAPARVEPIEEWDAETILQRLWQEEQAAGERLSESLPQLAQAACELAARRKRGGRLLTIGAGTSGRIAAIDAVEMPATFRSGRSEFVALIAGGTADSALSIEDGGEEDISAVPEMLLLQPGPDDMVLGISASGTSFFVRSALAFARSRGAFTVMLHESELTGDAFFDLPIPLCSGPEVVSGSTRMKAGTATKKALNFLGTTAMILEGKVRGGFMIDFDPNNAKLHRRALRILQTLTGQPEDRCQKALEETGNQLTRAIEALESGD